MCWFYTNIEEICNDTKTAQVQATESDRQIQQTCLNLIFNWSMWNEFNIFKCKALQVGRTNHKFNYTE